MENKHHLFLRVGPSRHAGNDGILSYYQVTAPPPRPAEGALPRPLVPASAAPRGSYGAPPAAHYGGGRHFRPLFLPGCGGLPGFGWSPYFGRTSSPAALKGPPPRAELPVACRAPAVLRGPLPVGPGRRTWHRPAAPPPAPRRGGLRRWWGWWGSPAWAVVLRPGCVVPFCRVPPWSLRVGPGGRLCGLLGCGALNYGRQKCAKGNLLFGSRNKIKVLLQFQWRQAPELNKTGYFVEFSPPQ